MERRGPTIWGLGFYGLPPGVGEPSRRPRPVKGKEIWAARIRCFQGGKNRMSEIVCWNLSWRARILASPGRLGLLLSLLSIRGEIGTRQALLTFFLFPYSIFISFYYFIYYLFLVPISFIFSTLPKRLEVDIFRTWFFVVVKNHKEPLSTTK